MSNWQDKNFQAFYVQRANAAKRRIRWELTFEQWLDIWKKSGKLKQRGRNKGQYCMARFKDRGPYAIGNVEIMSFSANNHDANFKRVRTERNRKNIADGITAYWANLTNVQRAERGKQISKAQIKSGAHKRAWQDPEMRKRHSRGLKRAWAKLTAEQRIARGKAISDGRKGGSPWR